MGAALEHPQRWALLPCYALGVLLFLLLLHPLPDPSFFGGGTPTCAPPHAQSCSS